MERATAADVIATFGALDEDLVARIVALEPTKAQLLEAKAWMAADHYMGPAGKPPIGAVKEICDLIEAAEAQLVEEDGPATPPAS
jgi:hypothetical protein